MSSPIQTPKSAVIHQDLKSHENDVVFMGALHLDETLNRKPEPREDPRGNEGGIDNEEFEEDEGVAGEIGVAGADDDAQVAITQRDVSATTTPRLTYARRKKGKGKAKSNARKELAIKEKLQLLLSGLNPIPFIPHKALYYRSHERLMRKIGLWDFVNIEFDSSIRVDLIAQLVASYEPKSRASYVNGFRIMVNRADLGRALKLSVKKEKVNAGGGGDVDLEGEFSSKEFVGLIEQFLSDWLLLHEDAWMTPKEVLNWLDVIKNGHPEKVDWAGLIWFMVEKELTLGSELKDCYYASHLQLLLKSQREELFLMKDYTPETVELVMESKVEEEEGDDEERNEEANDTEVKNEEGKEKEGVDAEEDLKGKETELGASELTFATREEDFLRKEQNPEVGQLYEEPKEDKEEKHDEAKDDEVNYGRGSKEEGERDEGVTDVGDIKEGKEEENCLMGGPSTKLTLGQDGEEEDEEMKEMEMMYSEKYKDNDEEVSEEDEGQGQWIFQGKNDLGEHFMQRCDNDGEFGSFDDVKEVDDNDDDDDKEEEEEEEEEDEEEEDAGDEPVHVFPDDDALEGNALMGNLLQTIEENQIAFDSQHPSPSMEMQHTGHPPSFLNHSGKRTIDHDIDGPHHELNGCSNKKIRINGPWDNKPMDFGTCMLQIQQMAEKAKIMYEQKEQVVQDTSMNQRILLSEVEKRDEIINQLHKVRMEEVQQKDTEIYRLNRELHLLESVLDGYRKALKQTQKAFDEYRERAKLKEEPVYRDAWPGGLMLSSAEIEAFRKECECKCLLLESQVGEAEAYFVEKLSFLDGRLRGLEAEATELFELNTKRKNKKTEAEKVAEVDEEQPSLQTEEEAIEVAEQVPFSLRTEEEAMEVAEQVPSSLQTEEEAIEVAEQVPSSSQTEEEAIKVAEQVPSSLQTEEEEEEAAAPYSTAVAEDSLTSE